VRDRKSRPDDPGTEGDTEVNIRDDLLEHAEPGQRLNPSGPSMAVITLCVAADRSSS